MGLYWNLNSFVKPPSMRFCKLCSSLKDSPCDRRNRSGPGGRGNSGPRLGTGPSCGSGRQVLQIGLDHGRAGRQQIDQGVFALDGAVHDLVHGGGQRAARRAPAVERLADRRGLTVQALASGCRGCEPSGRLLCCCAIALSETSREAVSIHFEVRITSYLPRSSHTSSTPTGKPHARPRSNPRLTVP